MKKKFSVVVAEGDGIGPEIMEATLQVLQAVQAPLLLHHIDIGKKVYLQGEPTGIAKESKEALTHADAFLKAPVTTPQGGGFKSVNVTLRGWFGLFANVRPCLAYAPFVPTKHPHLNVVIIRENEEDLYTGIEYRPSRGTYQALKILTEEGCFRIIRYAFEYARAHGRKKVSCFTKDNILKMTDGLFHQLFEEIALSYPDIETEHWIVDIGSAKFADHPELFDVIVLPNLYGDILSDVAAQLAGSVGLAGSANIGYTHAMFEAIHGSAPKRAGQNVANPSGLILASVQMLAHLGCIQKAGLIHNAWLKTIEEGIHTYDIYHPSTSRKQVGTKEFGQAVVERLGDLPSQLAPVQYKKSIPLSKERPLFPAKPKRLIGADLFIEWGENWEELQKKIQSCLSPAFQIDSIHNRGSSIWPTHSHFVNLSDLWRFRIHAISQDYSTIYAQFLHFLELLWQEEQISITQWIGIFSFEPIL